MDKPWLQVNPYGEYEDEIDDIPKPDEPEENRPKYRSPKLGRAVKVYTPTLESRYLIFRNIPQINVIPELINILNQFGEIENYRELDDVKAEAFTDTLWVQYKSIQNARYCKHKMNRYFFYGSHLFVYYDIYSETVEDTLNKLITRRNDVKKRLRQKQDIISRKSNTEDLWSSTLPDDEMFNIFEPGDNPSKKPIQTLLGHQHEKKQFHNSINTLSTHTQSGNTTESTTMFIKQIEQEDNSITKNPIHTLNQDIYSQNINIKDINIKDINQTINPDINQTINNKDINSQDFILSNPITTTIPDDSLSLNKQPLLTHSKRSYMYKQIFPQKNTVSTGQSQSTISTEISNKNINEYPIDSSTSTNLSITESTTTHSLIRNKLQELNKRQQTILEEAKQESIPKPKKRRRI